MCSCPWGDDGGLATVMATACPQEGGGYGGHGPRGPSGSQAEPLFHTPGLTSPGAALCLKASEVVTWFHLLIFTVLEQSEQPAKGS